MPALERVEVRGGSVILGNLKNMWQQPSQGRECLILRPAFPLTWSPMLVAASDCDGSKGGVND
jgi:hypothetical protein